MVVCAEIERLRGRSYKVPCDICKGGDCKRSEDVQELIQPEDSEATFKETFASSLESQANEMDNAIEAFVDYKDVQGNLMACRSWLRRTAISIRAM